MQLCDDLRISDGGRDWCSQSGCDTTRSDQPEQLPERVKTATAQFVSKKVATIGTCLQAVSTQIVKNNALDASGAASICVKQFRKVNVASQNGLAVKLLAQIQGKCSPGQAGITHTEGDIVGVGATVSQPLNAGNLGAWCAHFYGDGSIDDPNEWENCILNAAECDADSTIAVQYPRVLDWLALVKPVMQALTPPPTDPLRITEALAALDMVRAAIDGADDDNVVSIQCGGSAATGTAGVADVLTGKTFSNSTASGPVGTMPNNGAVTLTPSTSDQTIAAGYHNGAGKCAGDTDLIAGNIRSGVNLFGVNGDSNVVNTSSETAAAGDLLSGKIAWVAGAQVTGSMPNNGAVTLTPSTIGLKTFTIPDGLYSGSKTATANDSNLIGGNIVTGATIFGVAGTQPPRSPSRPGRRRPTAPAVTGMCRRATRARTLTTATAPSPTIGPG